MTQLRFSGNRRRASAVLFVTVLIVTLWPSLASAHAFLDTSDPTANAVVATAPQEIKLEFTERIQPSSSRAELYNADAQKVDTPPSHIGSNPRELILPLPADLSAGTYTVQWQNVSADDGHPNSGYFAFTIGGQADVVLPAPPPAPPTAGIVSLGTMGRWFGLLGLAAIIGSLIIWRWVIEPSITGLSDSEQRRLSHQLRMVIAGGIGLAAVGSGMLLVDHIQSSGEAISLGTLTNTLGETRFGVLLTIRVLLLLCAGVFVWKRNPLIISTSAWNRRFALVVVAALPVPFALNSHAAALVDGAPAAVTSDWIHLEAASIWIGGLISLVVVLVATRRLSMERRRAVLAGAIPRFSTLAIASVILLGLTGFYASWLEVGNINALLHTTYGRTLIVKLLLLIPLLLLGAINLLIVGPRMRESVDAVRHFGKTVGAEIVIGVLVLGVVGTLVALPTGREILTFSSGHPTFQYEQSGIRAVLQVFPGTVGINRYTADVQPSKGRLPDSTQVFLRISSVGQVSGQQQVTLQQEPGRTGRYTAQGRELSLVGNWNVDLVVRRPGVADWDVASKLQISRTPAAETAPGLPLRFLGYAPAFGIVLAAIAVVLLVMGLRRKRTRSERQFTVESALALTVAAVVILFVSRAPGLPSSTGNPVPKTPDSIAAGKDLFLQHCVACHGTDGHGDGPMAASLNPPPADLYAAHVDYHTDKQLFDWIKGGINGSAMPGFKGQMSDRDIWNVVNYVRSLRHPE